MKSLFLFLTIFSLAFQGLIAQPKEIENKIMFLYLPQDISVPIAIRCGDLPNRIPHLTKYKFVSDTIFFKLFNERLNNLKAIENIPDPYVDTRIECWFKFKDSEELSTICFGEYGGIFYSGQLMVEDTVLVKMVKNFVWGTADNCDAVDEGSFIESAKEFIKPVDEIIIQE